MSPISEKCFCCSIQVSELVHVPYQLCNTGPSFHIRCKKNLLYIIKERGALCHSDSCTPFYHCVTVVRRWCGSGAGVKKVTPLICHERLGNAINNFFVSLYHDAMFCVALARIQWSQTIFETLSLLLYSFTSRDICFILVRSFYHSYDAQRTERPV